MGKYKKKQRKIQEVQQTDAEESKKEESKMTIFQIQLPKKKQVFDIR